MFFPPQSKIFSHMLVITLFRWNLAFGPGNKGHAAELLVNRKVSCLTEKKADDSRSSFNPYGQFTLRTITTIIILVSTHTKTQNCYVCSRFVICHFKCTGPFKSLGC